MWLEISQFDNFFARHHIDLFKDIILPGITLDKIIAIVAVIYTVRTYRANSKLARINFSYQITISHRDIWSKIYNDPGLKEVTNSQADISQITEDQKRFVVFILLNNEISYEAFAKGIHDYTLASQKDTGEFFNLPIPNEVWQHAKEFYEPDFVKFIDNTKVIAKLKNLKPKSFIRKSLYWLKKSTRGMLLVLIQKLR